MGTSHFHIFWLFFAIFDFQPYLIQHEFELCVSLIHLFSLQQAEISPTEQMVLVVHDDLVGRGVKQGGLSEKLALFVLVLFLVSQLDVMGGQSVQRLHLITLEILGDGGRNDGRKKGGKEGRKEERKEKKEREERKERRKVERKERKERKKVERKEREKRKEARKEGKKEGKGGRKGRKEREEEKNKSNRDARRSQKRPGKEGRRREKNDLHGKGDNCHGDGMILRVSVVIINRLTL